MLYHARRRHGDGQVDAGGVLRDALDEGVLLYGQPFKRVESLLELADEDLVSAKAAVRIDASRQISCPAVRRKSHQGALEYRDINPGREKHRLGVLADMLPTDDAFVVKN